VLNIVAVHHIVRQVDDVDKRLHDPDVYHIIVIYLRIVMHLHQRYHQHVTTELGVPLHRLIHHVEHLNHVRRLEYVLLLVMDDHVLHIHKVLLVIIQNMYNVVVMLEK